MVGSVTGRNVMRLMPSIYQGPNHGSEFYTLGHLWIATLYVLDAPPTDLPSGPALNPLLLTGPDLVGYLFSYALFGVLGVQTYLYYVRYPSDGRALRMFVLAIFLVECLTTVLMTYSAWATFVSGWGNPMALLGIPGSSAALNPIAGCLFSSIHFFYAWRIHRLVESVVVPAAVVFVSLAQLGICFYVSTKFARASSLMDVSGALDNVYITWLSTSAFCDVLVSGALLHVLIRAKSQLAMMHTRPLISRIITLTMETTALTTVAAAVSAVLSATLPMTRFHFMMFLILMKIYSNTLLVTLNARNAHRQTLEGSTEVVFWSDQTDLPMSGHSFAPTLGTRFRETDGPRYCDTEGTASMPAMQFALPLQERRRGRTSGEDATTDDASVLKQDIESTSEHWK